MQPHVVYVSVPGAPAGSRRYRAVAASLLVAAAVIALVSARCDFHMYTRTRSHTPRGVVMAYL